MVVKPRSAAVGVQEKLVVTGLLGAVGRLGEKEAPSGTPVAESVIFPPGLPGSVASSAVTVNVISCPASTSKVAPFAGVGEVKAGGVVTPVILINRSEPQHPKKYFN